MTWIAALPMYDWPELRDETDRLWADMRARFVAKGIDAPQHLTRRNGDMPAVPGGIRGADGASIAADPATLDPDALDLAVLWRHPALLISGTCWGPMEFGLQDHVQVIGQSDYSGIPGGTGEFYSSAIIARKADGEEGVEPTITGDARLPRRVLGGKTLAFNENTSLSGYLSLKRDLEAEGAGLDLFKNHVKTGAHRASIIAVAEGRADIAAIDCKSWMLAQRHEPAAQGLHAIGWTARRKGLPLIRAEGVDLPFAM